MNYLNATTRLVAGKSALVAALALASIGAWAQDSTTTTVRHGEPSYDTQVKNAEVVYVEGNDLVLKLENGKVEHLVVPDSDKFTIDGREVTVRDLKEGTKLTQTITTSTAPRYITTVRTLKGKVWHVQAPSKVIVSLPDHTNQMYSVPKHATFIVDGKPKTVFDLKKGMRFEATIVSEDSENVIARDKSTTGIAPAPPTVPMLGVLLFQRAPETPVTLASVEEPAASLPETGTSLPLMGLLGMFGFAGSLGLRLVRKKVTA